LSDKIQKQEGNSPDHILRSSNINLVIKNNLVVNYLEMGLEAVILFG